MRIECGAQFWSSHKGAFRSHTQTSMARTHENRLLLVFGFKHSYLFQEVMKITKSAAGYMKRRLVSALERKAWPIRSQIRFKPQFSVFRDSPIKTNDALKTETRPRSSRIFNALTRRFLTWKWPWKSGWIIIIQRLVRELFYSQFVLFSALKATISTTKGGSSEKKIPATDASFFFLLPFLKQMWWL